MIEFKASRRMLAWLAPTVHEREPFAGDNLSGLIGTR
jgi:hypothetical protein